MIIGVPKEIKEQEYRVGLTPNSVKEYVSNGHEVYVQSRAGIGSGFKNKDYVNSGAKILKTIEEVYSIAQMIIKVKEPIKQEYKLLKKDLILYIYLHLAANKKLTLQLMKKKVKAVAYETITDINNQLPCLKPMSEIAGKLSVQEDAKYLEKPFEGRGVLLGGATGAAKGNIVIIGAGTVGSCACEIAVGLGADVTVLNPSQHKLDDLKCIYGTKIHTKLLTRESILESIKEADFVVGAVLIKGASAPKLILRPDLKLMKKNALIVDVSIDQGGCFETSKPTTHHNPIYKVNGVIHYCVANMPGCVPITATQALNTATLKYGLEIANKGLEQASQDNTHIKNGINVYAGKCTNQAVAKSLGITD
jgi:alanine dehydrogenase